MKLTELGSRKGWRVEERIVKGDWGFPGSSVGKESIYNARRPGFAPWVRKIPWEKKWQPTPPFLPGESHGQRSLADCSPWGDKESDTTD